MIVFFQTSISVNRSTSCAMYVSWEIENKIQTAKESETGKKRAEERHLLNIMYSGYEIFRIVFVANRRKRHEDINMVQIAGVGSPLMWRFNAMLSFHSIQREKLLLLLPLFGHSHLLFHFSICFIRIAFGILAIAM